VAVSTGEYIACVDGDDWISKDLNFRRTKVEADPLKMRADRK